MLRYDSPVINSGRIANRSVEVHGCPMHPKQSIGVSLAAANRDPSVYPDPDRFDIERADTHHQSFGGGRHFCLGAPLARAEAQETIRALLNQLSGAVTRRRRSCAIAPFPDSAGSPNTGFERAHNAAPITGEELDATRPRADLGECCSDRRPTRASPQKRRMARRQSTQRRSQSIGCRPTSSRSRRRCIAPA